MPAYLDPELKSHDLLTGVSFASGGTGYDNLTAKPLSLLSVWDQLNLFKEYAEKLNTIAGEDGAANIISNSLYFICAGNNDILFTYELYRKSNDDIPSYASFLVQIASNLIKELYSLGARKFAAVGVPPLGCVPSERFLYGGIQQDCAASSNEASIQFNNNLIREIGELQTKFFGMKIVYVDLFTPVDHIIGHPTQYGFEEVSNGCCGSGTIETSILCNSLDKHTCKDTSKYVFWDSFHPTQKTFEIVVRGIVKELSHLI